MDETSTAARRVPSPWPGSGRTSRPSGSFAGLSNLDVWYARLDVNGVIQRWGAGVAAKRVKEFHRNVAKASAKDQMKARAKLTRTDADGLHFVSDPPLLVPVAELYSAVDAQAIEELIHETIRSYRRTLQGDRRRLLESYRFVDLARKVVGVGSVGTRAWVALFVGANNADTLILQVKEAEASVLERFVGRSAYNNQGQRVVEGQRVMQAASDIFLGWRRVSQGVDGRPHDYYVRQLWDWKLSADIDLMQPDALSIYAQLCGWTLARAHARSGDRVAIGSYMGGSDAFPQALARFAAAYADQNDTDHQALLKAIANGTVAADTSTPSSNPLLRVGFTPQARATAAVKAVKMNANLVAGHRLGAGRWARPSTGQPSASPDCQMSDDADGGGPLDRRGAGETPSFM